jgi:hypothetical protein
MYGCYRIYNLLISYWFELLGMVVEN